MAAASSARASPSATRWSRAMPFASGGAGPDCFAPVTGQLISQGFNLIQNAADCNVGADPTSLTGVDPRIGPLADNGGSTQTHVLLADEVSPSGSTVVSGGCAPRCVR